jgi:hypothetical protein
LNQCELVLIGKNLNRTTLIMVNNMCFLLEGHRGGYGMYTFVYFIKTLRRVDSLSHKQGGVYLGCDLKKKILLLLLLYKNTMKKLIVNNKFNLFGLQEKHTCIKCYSYIYIYIYIKWVIYSLFYSDFWENIIKIQPRNPKTTKKTYLCTLK